jgi:hypothetical protein
MTIAIRNVLFGIFLVGGGLVGALVVWTLTGAGQLGQGVGRGALDTPDETFSLSGELAAVISPGVYAPLDLRIVNPNDHDLRVTDIEVTVADVDAPHATADLPCTPEDFDVDQVDSDFEARIAAGVGSTLTQLGLTEAELPHVGMPLDDSANQNGCKGASLTLAYTAVGRADE